MTDAPTLILPGPRCPGDVELHRIAEREGATWRGTSWSGRASPTRRRASAQVEGSSRRPSVGSPRARLCVAARRGGRVPDDRARRAGRLPAGDVPGGRPPGGLRRGWLPGGCFMTRPARTPGAASGAPLGWYAEEQARAGELGAAFLRAHRLSPAYEPSRHNVGRVLRWRRARVEGPGGARQDLPGQPVRRPIRPWRHPRPRRRPAAAVRVAVPDRAGAGRLADAVRAAQPRPGRGGGRPFVLGLRDVARAGGEPGAGAESQPVRSERDAANKAAGSLSREPRGPRAGAEAIRACGGRTHS